jgi:hypothetical protein
MEVGSVHSPGGMFCTVKTLFFFLNKIIFNIFDILMSKINLKNKNFNIFINKKYFET